MKPHLPLINRGGKKNPEKSARRIDVDLLKAGLAIGTIVILSLLLSIQHVLPSKVSLKVGDISEESIFAQKVATYKDTTGTQLRRAQAAASVARVYDPVPSAADQAIAARNNVFHALEEVRNADAALSIPGRITKVRERLSPAQASFISDKTFAFLLTAKASLLREVEDDSLRIVSSAMNKGIREDSPDMAAARRAVMTEAAQLLGDAPTALVVGEVAQSAIRPNQVYNEARTQTKQERARDAVQTSYGSIRPGELIIDRGDRVLQEHIEKFEALGLLHPKLDYRSVVSLTLFVVVVVLMVTVFLWRYHTDIYTDNRALLLLALIVIGSTFALRIGGSLLGVQLSPAQVGYLGILWVVSAGMFIAVLVDPQVAILITAMLSIVLSMMLNNEVRYAASALLTSLVGIYCVANIRDRNDSMRAIGVIGATSVGLVWIIGGINDDSITDMLIGSAWAAAIAAAATWLFWIGTWLLERPFGRTTHISLLELADTNKPLLKRLVMEAPGTYTHSMAVGHLAETAAEAIGADSLVARVGSYYHDIGKIRRPHFFVENQHVENVHDRMNPTLSTLVITSHIKDGIEIAKEFRLPKIVQDMIAQHHGTSLVQYFYSQFAGEEDPSTVLEQQFRYGGPKPQTKEAAIVMLADSAEAASRCLDKPTPSKIEMLVNRVVADKLRDGQLDECELTFREISKITSCFVRALTGTMHARIEYPDPLSTDGRKLVANGNSDSELAKDSSEDTAPQERGSAPAAS